MKEPCSTFQQWAPAEERENELWGHKIETSVHTQGKGSCSKHKGRRVGCAHHLVSHLCQIHSPASFLVLVESDSEP